MMTRFGICSNSHEFRDMLADLVGAIDPASCPLCDAAMLIDLAVWFAATCEPVDRAKFVARVGNIQQRVDDAALEYLAHCAALDHGVGHA